MSEQLRVALVGNPNCGKTSLFNQLTGTKQKVGNYAGVTVERKEGFFQLNNQQSVRILDLPGTYSLNSASPDEEVTRRVCLQEIAEEAHQDAFLLVADATNLRLNLSLVLEMIALNRPVLLVLNMMDEARRRGININVQKLSEQLGIPVVESVATRRSGVENLINALQQAQYREPQLELTHLDLDPGQHKKEIERILADTVTYTSTEDKRSDFLDAIFLHPVFGLFSLAILMFVIFQAVFAWAEPFIGWIEDFFAWLGELAGEALGEGLLSSLVVDGFINGAGSVVVFLPQIIILFFFILVLEESGYLPRAAFLLDKLMFKAGLSGRSFIPLLSSFACAVPGVMSARTISDPRDRLTTIMVAPLMTCSARLPVYTLLIGAFIPDEKVMGLFNLQGLVLFGLYMGGIFSALVVAYVMKLLRKDKSQHLLMMELPSYRFPNMQSVAIGLLERTKIFLRRVGTIIFALVVLLWVLCTFPQPPENATMPAIDYSFAGMLGHILQPIFEPIGFNWQIVISLIPAMAAREVIIAALGTVYSISGADDEVIAEGLAGLITTGDLAWSFATGISLLVWFIYAPHCLSTLATVKRETQSWKITGVMTIYLFALAYVMSFIAYHITVALTA